MILEDVVQQILMDPKNCGLIDIDKHANEFKEILCRAAAQDYWSSWIYLSRYTDMSSWTLAYPVLILTGHEAGKSSIEGADAQRELLHRMFEFFKHNNKTWCFDCLSIVKETDLRPGSTFCAGIAECRKREEEIKKLRSCISER